ncbi:GNAT family N-acetyltransferase [Streptomyces sp. 4N124]|uniref:GNAT family N-acetyltransferase n=1 Tax=Streptomyces sp. 4N124 TaxID=3457420 RepID=UPI003FD59AD3
MPPTDASADAGTAAVTDVGPATADESATRPSPDADESRTGTDACSEADCEDTLDLRLPEEFIALFAQERAAAEERALPEEQTDVREQADTGAQSGAREQADAGRQADDGQHGDCDRQTDAQDRADADRPAAAHGLAHPSRQADALERAAAGWRAGTDGKRSRGGDAPHSVSSVQADDDLLDHVADWGPTVTPAGVFRLVPVDPEQDLPLVSRWMNDPAVAAFWGLEGAQNTTEDHVRAQFAGDGRSIPCLGVLEGTPMSYWEVYRADLDPLARHYPARPHDTGIHLLIGRVADRGRGLGGTLLRAVADLALDKRPACARVVAEPDLRNTPSVAAFLSAGFRFSAEIELPAKRAALMVRDRSLRHLL